ncbi:cytochrome P450 [Nocardia wallacei]|uniref:Cytochrome P450 n=1 Tax=Nocardia wallacei TaxID=480035 RepID=A0A7G1KM46_9NOCA|nr:cytochrome P450 [Nocardia wallacei]BCK56272.1 cytochrome P450 [Nocardia wallacei]
MIADAPKGLPLLGHALQLFRDPLAFLESLPPQGALVRIGLGPMTAVVICDPDLTRQVLQDDRVFDKGGVLFDRAREVFGMNLVTCPHSRHRRQRRLVQPAFHSARLPGYAKTMANETAAVVGGWRDGQILDIPAETGRLAMRIAMETMFSGSLAPHALHRAIDDLTVVTGGILRRAMLPPWLNQVPTPANWRYNRAGARLERMVDDIVAERRCADVDHDDLLSALLTACAPGRSDMIDFEIRDQIIAFFGAGSETTANTLAWALHMIARHPGVEQRLHAEVDNVLAGAPAGWADIPRLELTSRVITETLRLCSPAWIFTRIVSEDVNLDGNLISAGTTLVCSPYLVHRDDRLYDRPLRFDPDRWGRAGQSQPPRHAFLPFGWGARKCIGEQFAHMEAVVALSTITARWRLESVDDRPVRPPPAATLIPHGLRLRARSRITT